MEQRLQKLEETCEELRCRNENLYRAMKAFQIAVEESGNLVFIYYADKQTILMDERTAAAFRTDTVQTGVPYEIVKQGIVSEDTREEYIRIHEAIMRGEQEASGIVKLKTGGGQNEIVYELRLRVIPDRDGGSTRTAVGIYHDITERFREECEKERYRQTVFSSDRFSFQYDVRQDLFTVYAAVPGSGAQEERFEYPHYGRSLEQGEICPERDILVMQELFKNGAHQPVRVQLYDRRTGALRWYSLTGSVLREKGEASRVFGTLWDVTDLKEKEHSHQKLERVLLSLKEEYIGIFEVDLELDFYTTLYLDGAMMEMPDSGCYSRIMYDTVERLASPEYRDVFRKFADPSFLRERLSKEHRIETEYRTAGKGNAWRRTMFQAVEYRDGAPVKIIIYQQDIDRIKTEELRQQQTLQEACRAAEAANAAKTEFLSRMSHDIRTPMNAIIGMTAIAGTHLEEPDRVEECLEKISISSRHLLSLINEVLDMSKIESGKMELQEEEFHLAELIDDTITIVLPQINQHGHSLSVNIEHLENEWVVGDNLRLQQAFVNLLTNAIKYTPDGGQISLYIREKEDQRQNYREYEFVFADNGIGMSEEFQSVMFDPFTREEDSRTGKVVGTGLGMAITRSIIRMMDGDIEVSSKPGEGSCFRVTVHLQIPDQAAESCEELLERSVLIVDDDRDTCESAALILNNIGMRAEWCLSGREAVERIRERHDEDKGYFAVILDWKMPEMNGLETAKAIRRAVGEDLPIILISAYDWSDIETEAREAGIFHFVAKPLFRSRLISRLKELLRKDEKREEQNGLFEEPMDFSGRRVLLAEDNELNAEIAMEILRMAKVDADWVSDGREALKRLEESPEGCYDMIFMDIQMPVMNGYEAAEAIRRLEREDVKTIPIVAMTANAFTEDIRRARQSGMNEHIAKPIDFVQLEKILRLYLT